MLIAITIAFTALAAGDIKDISFQRCL